MKNGLPFVYSSALQQLRSFDECKSVETLLIATLIRFQICLQLRNQPNFVYIVYYQLLTLSIAGEYKIYARMECKVNTTNDVLSFSHFCVFYFHFYG